MKFIIFFILVLNLWGNEKTEYRTSFGFLYKGTILSNFKDARHTLSKWLNDTASKHDGSVRTEFYPDSKTLYADFKKDKLDMIVLNLDFFFKNRKEIEEISETYWTLLSNDIKHTQLYLIANKSSNINSFKNIKGKTISLKEDDKTSEIWLDKNSLKFTKKSSLKSLKDITYVTKESTLMLNVFFKKTDLAVVTKETWETMSELNPAIKKKIKIVQKSKKIHLPFIGLFSKKANQLGKKSFMILSKDIFSLDGGEQISDLLKFDTLYWLDNKDLVELDKYYNEYFLLKDRYK